MANGYKDLSAEWQKEITEEEFNKLEEGRKSAVISQSMLGAYDPRYFGAIQAGRDAEARAISESNRGKTEAQREIDFAKNDAYNAGMAANFIGKMGTLNRRSKENKENLADYRKPTDVPLAQQNTNLAQALGNSQYAQARGLGADVLGNMNSRNTQAFLNAMRANSTYSNQAGDAQSQNQSLFNKVLDSQGNVAQMQMQYQDMANQNLNRNIAMDMQQDRQQDSFNGQHYVSQEALRARDVDRAENLDLSNYKAMQDTTDTAPYLASKWTGDYKNMNQQRNLDPNRGFMNKHLFANQQRNGYIQPDVQADSKREVPMYLNRNTQPVQAQASPPNYWEGNRSGQIVGVREPIPSSRGNGYWNTNPSMQRPVMMQGNTKQQKVFGTPSLLDINADPFTQESLYNYNY